MTLLLFLAALAAIGIVLAVLATVYEWRPVPHIKAMWRWWTVRLQTISALVTGWLFFEPTAMLAALNLMPGHIRAQLPDGINQALSIVFGAIFVLNLLSIVARGVDQPKARK